MIGALWTVIVLLAASLAYAIFKLISLWREKLRLEGVNVHLQAQLESTREKLEWSENAKRELENAFKSIASEVTSKNTEVLLTQANDKLGNVVDPLKDALKSLNERIQDIERRREGAYGELKTLVGKLLETHSELQREIVGIKSVFKSSTPRGRWGEYELRRIVELAGMTKYVSFIEQEAAGDGRPDMVVMLPERGFIPVDAKVPLGAYIEAMETDDPKIRQEKLKKHVENMKGTIHRLSKKEYWNSFERSPEFVIMFVPVEPAVRAAFELDPNLLDEAFDQKVLIATPITLFALLKAVAFGWQRFQWAENAKKIAQEGSELLKRANKFVEHYDKVGKTLDTLVKTYNKSVGSFEGRFLPSLKRISELSGSGEELPSVSEVETHPRSFRSLEGNS